MISLISYNIRFGKELGRVVGWLKKTNPKPDIICIQEFPESKLEEIGEMLGKNSYKFEFAPSFQKKRVRFGELTLFRPGKLRLTSSKIIQLGESKLDSTIFRYKSHRSSLATEFDFKGKKILVVNVHLIWLGLHRSRKNQLKKTISALNRNIPTIIVGDYNYSLLLGRKKGLLKFMEEFGYKMAGERVVTHKLWKIPQQIDYAFYKGLKVSETKVIRLKYSDHFPITIGFDI